MPRRGFYKQIFLFLVIALITFLHYSTETSEHHFHILYQGLYFIPVVLAGLWFGLRGGMASSAGITFLYIPFIYLTWNNFSSMDLNNVMELTLYNAMAVIVGMQRERERAKETLLREAERLSAMGKSLSGVAHDLKSPLVAIGGFSRLLQKHVPQDCPHRDKLGTIIEETNRLEALLKDILDFSRPLELRRSAENVEEMINHILSVAQVTAQGKQVTLRWEMEKNFPPFLVDSGRLQQALLNLCVNAIEASSPGEEVTLHAYRKRKEVILDIADRGCGIPSEIKHEIFFPFFTTKRSGTGLGLSITKKIVEAHGGSLEVLDNEGKGTVFRVTIPRN